MVKNVKSRGASVRGNSQEKYIHRQSFILKARHAVHHILFYLGLGYTPIGLSFLPFAKLFYNKIRCSSPDMQQRILGVVNTVSWDKAIENDEYVRDWIKYKKELSSTEFPLTDNNLINNYEDFLKKTKLQSHFINHVVPNFFIWAYKALTMLLSAIGILILILYVEQVRSIFLNAQWLILIPIVILLSTFLLPWLSSTYKSKKTGRVFFWDFGGVPFRSIISQARSPQHGFRFFGEKSQLPSLLLLRVVIISVLRLIWMSIVILAAWFHLKYTGDTNILTAVLVLSIFYILIACAEISDFLDFFSRHPIRLYFIFIGGLIIFFSNIEAGGAKPALLIFALLSIIFLYRTFFTKKSRIFDPFLAFVCAILVLINGYILLKKPDKTWKDETEEHIVERVPPNHWPWKTDTSKNLPVVVMATSGGGSRAAVFTAHTLEALHAANRKLSLSIQAISSVSGGSLANAAYVALRSKGVQKITKNLLVNAVNGDYIKPTIEGLLTVGRGEKIEETWRGDPTNLGSIKISKLVSKWNSKDKSKKYPPFPIPLFNTSTLDSYDVVISPLAREAYSPALLTRSAKGDKNRYDTILNESYSSKDTSQPTWVFYRDGIYGLEDLLPKYNPDLAESVRASANFPFGFPLVRVQTTQPLYFNPLESRRKPKAEEKYTVSLTDGGVLSNSGMWPLYRLLLNKAYELRERGVLLIIVEASRMPEYPTKLKRITGLSKAINSRDPTGQSLHRRMIEMLQQVYGNRIEVVQIDLIPTVKMNLMTTWTLSEKALEDLYESFRNRWNGYGNKSGVTGSVKYEIMHAWDRLKNYKPCNDEATRQLEYFSPRPPVN